MLGASIAPWLTTVPPPCAVQPKELDLSNNDLGNEGAKAIPEMIRANVSLQELNLHDNDIGGAAKDLVLKAVFDVKKQGRSFKIFF